MSGSTSPLRARIDALMVGAYGVAQWVIPAAMFHAIEGELEDVERTAVERAYTVHITQRVAIGPVNTLSGYGLFTRKLRVRVGYVLEESGDAAEYEVRGEQSGAATREVIEDRADADAVLITSVIGSLCNWAGLAGVEIIDIEPTDPEGDSPAMIGDRAIATHVFVVKSRDALPGAYAPTT